MKRPHPERGSAIIMLFVAVALFGMLAYAFMQGSRTSTSMMTDEQAKTYATQIIAYGNDVRTAVKRMTLRGTKTTQLSFETGVFQFQNGTPIFPAGYNPTCVDTSCQIFSVAGGSLTPIVISESATYLDPSMASPTRPKPGHWRHYIFNMNGIGTTTGDLTYVASSMSQKVCIALNKQLGVENPSGLPPEVPSTATNGYLTGGDYSTTLLLMGDLPILNGKKSYCYTLQGVGAHKFYNYITTLIEN